MASVVVGGLFNALAFVGFDFLFSKLNHSGYEAEIKRHNRVLEDLARTKETWYENEVAKRDRIQQLRMELSDAIVTLSIKQTISLDELGHIQTIQYNDMKFTRDPQLSDYYKRVSNGFYWTG